MVWNLLNIFWVMLWFFLFFIWIWLLISVFGDIFRSNKSGGAKALWILFVLVFPYLGVLVYLIVNGGDMQTRAVQAATDMENAQKEYIRSMAGGTSTADELTKLAALRDNGVLSAEEFAAQKAKLLA
jgi:hypothetical protein